MTKEEVIALAQKAAFHTPVQEAELLRFAALVAARERERYEAHRLQQEAWNIDTQYASLLALMLECMILDPRRWHDDAVKVLDQYRAEWDKLNPSPSPFGKD